MVLTTSSLFLHTLAQAGIDHIFANWGSDHPAILEDLERQRIESGFPAITVVTCPNEMVALSAAHGYTLIAGKPAALIVHVDAGTQALAGAVHNADRGRAPILIFAGAAPSTTEGELAGSRSEWIHWAQDVHDQPAIVRQYMRYTAELASPESLPHQVRRALQIATSEPKGPVYLWARREVTEQVIDSSFMEKPLTLAKWPSVQPTALPASAVQRISDALLHAKSPLLITSFLGRDHQGFHALVNLSLTLALPVFLTCPSAVNVPMSHPYFIGMSYLGPGSHTPLLKSADVILLIDTEVPWIPMNKDKEGRAQLPSDTAQVYVIESGDPLRRSVGMYHSDAEVVCNASGAVALGQLVEAIGSRTPSNLHERVDLAKKMHDDWMERLRVAESLPSDPSNIAFYTSPQIISTLRRTIDARGITHENRRVLNESITNFPLVWSHLRPEVPGEIYSAGGSSLGFGLGASIGSILAGRVTKKGGAEITIAVVGDGSYLFGVPASAFWMARRYETPFLTIVLNNGGWKAPRSSMLLVHPTGHGSKVNGDQLSVGFGPECPDYSQIAVAASNGWAWGRKISVDIARAKGKAPLELLQETIAEAVRVVVEDRRCAVIDCVLETI